MKLIILLILSSTLLFSCAKNDSDLRKSFYEKYSEDEIKDHKSILVLPAANDAVNIDAPYYFLSTISYPIAEKGYYVFPVNLVNRLLEDEGLSDPHMLNKSSPFKIAKKFGADAILYTTIEDWDAKYMGFATIITASLKYTLKSGKTGKIIWSTSQTVKYNSTEGLENSDGIGLVIALIFNAAASKAMSDNVHYGLVKEANITALQTGIYSLPNGEKFIPKEERNSKKIH
jgi:hypothetical protein